MRTAIAIVLVLLCSAAVLANGAKPPRVTPPPPPPAPAPVTVVPTPPPAPPAVPCQAVMTPVMMPVLMHCNMRGKTSDASNVMVLVPVTLSRDMINRAVSDRNIIAGVLPVTVPMMVGSQVSTSALAGAGPGTSMTMDQTSINNMISANSAVMMAMTAPVSMDQTLWNAVTCGQNVVIDEAMANRIMGTSTSMVMVPMVTGTASTGALVGRGPAVLPVSVDKATLCSLQGNTATVMIPMLMSKQTVNTMMGNNSIVLMAPMMTSLVNASISCPP